MNPSPDRPVHSSGDQTRGALIVPRLRRVRRRYRGLTLFGVLMGLTLFAAAVIGAVSLYNTAQETQDRNDAQALLTRLQVSVQQIYLGESAYPAGSLVPALDVRGAIPASARMTSGGGTDSDGNTVPVVVGVRHPFGAAVQVAGAGARFNILFEDLQNAACASLLDPYVGQGGGTSGLWQVSINGTALASPLTSAAVTTGCANGADNDVTFTFE